MITELDKQFMRYALELAQRAGEQKEVPVGAVLTYQDKIIAKAYNQPIKLNDPTAHAEILVLRQAAMCLSNYRLPATTLYVTLEPCPMCAGALVHARVNRIVIAALDQRSGACGSVMNISNHPALNHHITCETGLFAEQSAALLQTFFKARR